MVLLAGLMSGRVRSGWSCEDRPWNKRYRAAWLGTDVVAGLTLAAVAIPEVMGCDLDLAIAAFDGSKRPHTTQEKNR